MQVVPVAAVGENILLAVPFSSWHRKVAKRTLPSNFLQKPTLVEVVAVSEDDMDTRLEVPMKVWIGYLAPAYAQSLSPYKEEEEAELVHHFGVRDSEGCLPYAQSLFDAAQDHFLLSRQRSFKEEKLQQKEEDLVRQIEM